MKKNKSVQITYKNIKYVPQAWAWIIAKGIPLFFGCSISYLLYSKCLGHNEFNPIVVTYFSIIGLCCFENFGLPVSKLTNMMLEK